MESEALVNTVMAVMVLLFIAAVSALFLKRIRFPYTVGLVVLGVALAFLRDSSPALAEGMSALELGPELIMFVFIPILIFESAVNTDVRLLTRNLVPALVLAVVGLLASTALIGLGVAWLTALPLASALVFGVLISATDPVAVIALFKDLGAPHRLNILVEGESLFNDATAIVTFQIMLGVAVTGVVDPTTVTSGLINFVVVFFGGLIVGLGFGYLLALGIRLVGDEPLVQITLTLVVAYGAFIVAEHFLHTSGIMAVLGAGLVVGYYGQALYSPRVKEYLEIFWEDAAFVANSLIFLMLGLSEKVFLTNVGSNIGGLLVPVLIVIAIVIAARAVVVFGLVPVVNLIPGQRKVNRGYQTIMWWGGLRGAVAVALAISLPQTFPFRWQIIDFTFGIILFTLLVNGTTMGTVMNWLKLDRPAPLERYAHAFAHVLAKRAAVERLASHPGAGEVSDEVLADVRMQAASALAEAEHHLAGIRDELGKDEATQRDLLWFRALAIQKHTYQRRYDDGLLDLDSLHELEWDLRTQELALQQGKQPPAPPLLSAGRLNPVSAANHWLARWRGDTPATAYARAAALQAGANAVIDRFDTLRDFASVDEELLAHCRDYYVDIATEAGKRMHALEAKFDRPGRSLAEQQLSNLAADAERDVMGRLALHGALPDGLADRIEQRIDA